MLRARYLAGWLQRSWLRSAQGSASITHRAGRRDKAQDGATQGERERRGHVGGIVKDTEE